MSFDDSNCSRSSFLFPELLSDLSEAPNILLNILIVYCLLVLPITFREFAMSGKVSTKVYTKQKISGLHKSVYEAQNPAYGKFVVIACDSINNLTCQPKFLAFKFNQLF
jgi:hypothetical protein